MTTEIPVQVDSNCGASKLQRYTQSRATTAKWIKNGSARFAANRQTPLNQFIRVRCGIDSAIQFRTWSNIPNIFCPIIIWKTFLVEIIFPRPNIKTNS